MASVRVMIGFLLGEQSVPEVVGEIDDYGQPGQETVRVIAEEKVQHPKGSKRNQLDAEHGA